MSNQVSMDKKYMTRGGITDVRVLCTDADGDYPVVAIVGESICRYTLHGRFFQQDLSRLDLIEIPDVDWSKVPVDTKVRVWDVDGSSKHARHFAMYKDGKVHTWDSGGTSWSCGNDFELGVTAWSNAELAE